MAVEFKFTGDANQLAKEYDKLVRKVDKLERANAGLATKSKQAARQQKETTASTSRGLSTMIAGVGAWAASYVSVTAAIGLVNTALQEQARLSEEAHQRNVRVAGSQAAVIKNIGDVSDEETKAFLYKVDQIRQQTGFSSVVPLQQAASSILSATGGDQQKTLDILAASAPLFGTDPDNLATFGSSLGDVMKASGIKDARANAALMLGIQGQARFEDLSAFKNVAPALAAADVVTGGENETDADKLRDAREAAAAFAAIGSRAGDPDGNLTKTAAANLFANLRNVTRDAGAPAEVDTFKERLDFIRANPDLQPEVLKSGFKGAIKPIIEEFISSPESTTSRTFEDALSKIQASEEAFDRKTKQLSELTPELRAKTVTDASLGNVESFKGDPEKAAAAAARQVLVDTQKEVQTGVMGPIVRTMDRTEFDIAVGQGAVPEVKAAQLMGRVVEDLRAAQPMLNEQQQAEGEKKIEFIQQQQRELVQALTARLKDRAANQAGTARREATLPVE